MQQLQGVIEPAFERRADIPPASVDSETRDAINQVIALLDSGALRVSEKIDGEWVTHQWLKKAVLLSFRINDNQVMEGAHSPSIFSETRSAPLSIRAITWLMASRVSLSTLAGVMSARRSKADSITLCNCCIFFS